MSPWLDNETVFSVVEQWGGSRNPEDLTSCECTLSWSCVECRVSTLSRV